MYLQLKKRKEIKQLPSGHPARTSPAGSEEENESVASKIAFKYIWSATGKCRRFDFA